MKVVFRSLRVRVPYHEIPFRLPPEDLLTSPAMSFFKNLKLKRRAWWASRRRKRLQSFGSGVIGVVVETKAGTYVVDPTDAGVGRQLLLQGEYNKGELDTISQQLTLESRVLVVGAHIGSLVIPLSKRCASVTAVEANPDTFRLLSLNLKLNDCANVEPVQIAASDKKGSLDFLINRENSGGSKRKPLHSQYAFVYDSPQIRSVAAAPLDDLLSGRSFDLVLLDIEGSEYFALKGMRTLLEKSSSLIVEFRPDHLKFVAGVSCAQFLEQIPTHFSRALLPNKNLTCNRRQLEVHLDQMFHNGENEDGIIFTI